MGGVCDAPGRRKCEEILPVDIQIAKEGCRDKVRELLSEYLVELSAYGEVDHGYRYFDSYWSETDCRWPYLIFGDGEVIGFAFVNTISPSGCGADFSMAEFYIQPFARGNGFGMAAATELFQKHDGVWELSVMAENKRAQSFWPKAIAAIGGHQAECFELSGETIHRFCI